MGDVISICYSVVREAERGDAVRRNALGGDLEGLAYRRVHHHLPHPAGHPGNRRRALLGLTVAEVFSLRPTVAERHLLFGRPRSQARPSRHRWPRDLPQSG